MKAFLILEDGTVFEGTHIGADKEVISEIVFNTSMAGYLEVLTDPSYAGQAVCMTYPLIGNYGICKDVYNMPAYTGIYSIVRIAKPRKLLPFTQRDMPSSTPDCAPQYTNRNVAVIIQ